MEIVLEIIKISVPALIVFATVFFLMKQYLASQLELNKYTKYQEISAQTVPIQLQAYERLAMMTERIQIQNLIFRLREPGMSCGDLRMSMVVAVQKEYEHNISQQVYVSSALWQIILIARENTLDIINQSYRFVDKNDDCQSLVKHIGETSDSLAFNPIEKAQEAIRTEAGKLLK